VLYVKEEVLGCSVLMCGRSECFAQEGMEKNGKGQGGGKVV
jgi:hypothetical protein